MPDVNMLRPVLLLVVVVFVITACGGGSRTAIPPTLTAVQLVAQTATPVPSIAPFASATLPVATATAGASRATFAASTATAAASSTVPVAISLTPGATGTELPLQGQLPVTSGQPQVTAVAENLPNSDDLLIAPDGTLYISLIGDGSVRRLSSSGSLEPVVDGLSEPEGMLLLTDGSLIIAEQGKNRLVKFNPQTGVTPLVQLTNPRGQLGVDGIALDAHVPDSPSIIIPDSPNGTLLRASLDGKSIQTIASGLVRPTGAWVEPDGSILVVEEFGGTLVRVKPNGRREVLARNLSEPDDVVEDSSGRIFVNTLVDGAVHVFSNDGKQSQVVIDGLHSPQGIALDANGNLFVTDAGQGRILKIVMK